ncbi:MAG: hypothetical protein FWC79_00825 [Oscillospiraceae bacterium]|nr:hypothetical protein [Oscillospiraceae bacterium]
MTSKKQKAVKREAGRQKPSSRPHNRFKEMMYCPGCGEKIRAISTKHASCGWDMNPTVTIMGKNGASPRCPGCGDKIAPGAKKHTPCGWKA